MFRYVRTDERQMFKRAYGIRTCRSQQDPKHKTQIPIPFAFAKQRTTETLLGHLGPFVFPAASFRLVCLSTTMPPKKPHKNNKKKGGNNKKNKGRHNNNNAVAAASSDGGSLQALKRITNLPTFHAKRAKVAHHGDQTAATASSPSQEEDAAVVMSSGGYYET